MGDQTKANQGRELALNDLKKADVLLTRGKGPISDVIAWSDGSKYSHTTMWSGTGVIQASSAGITHQPLEVVFEDYKSFDVYRNHDLPPEGAQEIVKLALEELEGSYAYVELVLLGVLFMPGFRVRGAWVNQALKAIGGSTATKLKDWLDENAGKNVRVCSELVASSYYRAGKGHQFALRVYPAAERPKPSTQASSPNVVPAGANLAEMEKSCKDLLDAAAARAIPNPNGKEPRGLFSGTIALTPDGKEVGVVTPGDLQFSPSLQCIGTIRP
jgi:hypothetical protein